MNLGLKPLSFTSLSALWKSGDGVSDHFPAGLRVLVVDDDPTCLTILDKMLKNCLYQVTTCNRAEHALRLLRDNKNGFDIVISDVHMPDMDGFKLLEHVGLEMDLPVIMMSADDSKNIVMKGVTHGACDYLIKPVRMEALKNIWQHVVRKKSVNWKENDFEQANDGEQQQTLPEDGNYLEGNWQSSKKRKDDEEEAEERDDPSSLKKPRVVWSVELHQQFVNAVNQLGIDKAVPKKILELMNVPGLTRENVASHLQKYRLYLRRLSGVSQHLNSFLGPSGAPFGPISSLDLQALAASGQLPQSTVTIPLSDQRSLFEFESRLRFVEGQQEQNSNGKQANLLHGVPTNMDSKQMAALSSCAHSQSTQSSILSSQMVQTQSRTQIFNDTRGSHALNLPLSVDQAILTIPCLEYPPFSQPSSIVDFSKSRDTEFPQINFSHGSNSGASSFTPKLQDEVSSEIKDSRSLFPNYNNVNWNGFADRGLNTGGSIFDASQQLQRGLNVLPSVSVQQWFCPNQNGKQMEIPSDKSVFSVDASADNNLLFVKAQRLPSKSFKNVFAEAFHPDDLMTALLKQQENGLEPVGAELGFNG